MAITIHSITNVDGDSLKEYELMGLSTDTKPSFIGDKPVDVNSLFWELDTDTFYYLKTAAGVSEVVFHEQTVESSEWTEAGNAYMLMPTDVWENGIGGSSSINVLWDDVEYTLEKQDGGLGNGYFGAYVDLSTYTGDFSVYPFGFYLNNEDGTAVIVVSKDNDDHTFKAFGTSITEADWKQIGQ